MSLILMTTLFYKAVILHGEIWRWSVLGLKGLNNALMIIMIIIMMIDDDDDDDDTN